MEKAMDPNLRNTASSYVSQASKKAQEAALGANEWGRQQFGVDVAGKAKEALYGPGSRGQYSTLGEHPGSANEEEHGGLYDDGGDDDFFDSHLGQASSSPTVTAHNASAKANQPASHEEEEDEWKDF